MNKKWLSTLLAISCVACTFTACGGGTDSSAGHTHTWASTWTNNETEHWHACDGCQEKKDKATHSGDTCSVCGYVKGVDDGLPVVSTVKDLQVTTVRSDDVGGSFIFVEFPDGKNMLVDAGSSKLDSWITLDWFLIDKDITTIDYFVLTTNRATRADSVFDYYQVNNFYLPQTSAHIESHETYNNAVEKAQSQTGCVVKTVMESNCDMVNTFKDSQNNVYQYKVDFMFSLNPEEAEHSYDYNTMACIEYQGKTVFLGGMASVQNIDAFVDKYAGQMDVDIFITKFLPVEHLAIASSPNRGKDFLASISFGLNDLAVIVESTDSTGISALEGVIRTASGAQKNMHSINKDRHLTTAVATVTKTGEVSVVSY